MSAAHRLLRALKVLEALRAVRAEAPEFQRAYDAALTDARRTAREFIGELETSPSTPAAKRTSETPPRGTP